MDHHGIPKKITDTYYDETKTKTPQKQRVATDTWRSLGCPTTPLEHWCKRKPIDEPRWAKQQTKKLRPQPKAFFSVTNGRYWTLLFCGLFIYFLPSPVILSGKADSFRYLFESEKKKKKKKTKKKKKKPLFLHFITDTCIFIANRKQCSKPQCRPECLTGYHCPIPNLCSYKKETRWVYHRYMKKKD